MTSIKILILVQIMINVVTFVEIKNLVIMLNKEE